MPDQSRPLLLQMATWARRDESLDLIPHNLLPMLVVLVPGVAAVLLPEGPAALLGAGRLGDLIAVLSDEDEAAEPPKVLFQELRISTTDDVRYQILACVYSLQEVEDLGSGRGHLWSGLELAQRAVIVEEESLRPGDRRPNFPNLLIRQLKQRPCWCFLKLLLPLHGEPLSIHVRRELDAALHKLIRVNGRIDARHGVLGHIIGASGPLVRRCSGRRSGRLAILLVMPRGSLDPQLGASPAVYLLLGSWSFHTLSRVGRRRAVDQACGGGRDQRRHSGRTPGPLLGPMQRMPAGGHAKWHRRSHGRAVLRRLAAPTSGGA
mmetsp:Transcript_38919/g.98782  ORF Transcript_38919/g.98782 Transcript_38919/m.98782 type:complete len:320 (+) Transcript_38919:570-1529(+)